MAAFSQTCWLVKWEERHPTL